MDRFNLTDPHEVFQVCGEGHFKQKGDITTRWYDEITCAEGREGALALCSLCYTSLFTTLCSVSHCAVCHIVLAS